MGALVWCCITLLDGACCLLICLFSYDSCLVMAIGACCGVFVLLISLLVEFSFGRGLVS